MLSGHSYPLYELFLFQANLDFKWHVFNMNFRGDCIWHPNIQVLPLERFREYLASCLLAFMND